MITYTYRCKHCDNEFEVMSTMMDTTPQHICRCGQMADKILVPGAFICDRADGKAKKKFTTGQNPSKPWY